MDSVDRLASITPPPAVPADPPTPADWHRAEQTVGVAFPDDLKQLLSLYGTGEFDRFMIILNPAARQARFNLREYSSEAEELLFLYQRRSQNLVKSSQVRRLIPIAYTINGDELFYTMNANGLAHLVIAESRGGDFEEFDGTLSDFLADFLSTKVKSRLFPPSVPSQNPSFKSIS